MVKNNLLRVLISTLVITPNIGYTAPTGGQVIAGEATISRPNANLTVITQSTARAVLQFDSFDINQNQTVQFVQPSSSSVALNRVTSANPTTILGNLTANGQVFIVNPRGVIFGQSARVDVAGLVATTLNISNNDFLAGRLNFTRVVRNQSADVTNAGEINADGGFVVLAGDFTENTGLIQANRGTVALTSGQAFTLDLGDGMINIAIDETAIGALRGVSNQGTILADGGTVILTASVLSDLVATAVRNDGLIQARSIVEREGEIFLAGFTGDTLNSGTLDVRGDSTVNGGQIAVTGERVAVFANAELDVSGQNGGSILIGEDGLGEAQTTRDTVVTGNVVLNVNALAEGDGGDVQVFADNSTRFSGNVSAQGGAVSGDGGSVEISGQQLLQFDGAVLLTATNGNAGTLLLDPVNIAITNSAIIEGGRGGAIAEGGNIEGAVDAELLDGTVLFDDESDFFIAESALENLTGNIILQAQNDIVLEDLADNTLNFNNLTEGLSVVFQAGNNIVFNDTADTITTQGASIQLEANSANIGVGANAETVGAVILGGLNTNGGDITVLGDVISILGDNISGGNINIGQGFTAGDDGQGLNAVLATASSIQFNAATTFNSSQDIAFTAQNITINNAFQAEGVNISFAGDVLGNAAFSTGTINLIASNDILFAGDLTFQDTAIDATASNNIVIDGDVIFTQTNVENNTVNLIEGSISFTGDLANDDDVLLFDFSTNDRGFVTIQTFSFAGGVNAQGEDIPAGGFDPIVGLFDDIGDFITQNDDGGNIFDSALTIELDAGDFTVSLSQFNNFFTGTNLNEGFPGTFSTAIEQGDASPFFALDISGATLVDANIAAGGLINDAIISNFFAGQDFSNNGNIDLTGLVTGSSVNFTTNRDTTINGDLLANLSGVNTTVGRDLTITGTTQIITDIEMINAPITFAADGDINLGNVQLIDNAVASAASTINFNAGGNLQVASLAATEADFNANIIAVGDVILGDVAALSVNVSTQGDVTLQNTLNSVTEVNIASTTGDVLINADLISQSGNIQISTSGDVTQTQGVIVAQEGGIEVQASSIELTNINASANTLEGDLAINISASDNVTLNDVIADAAPGLNVSIDQENITVNGDITASGSLSLTADSNITVLGASEISAGTALNINADANNDGLGNLSAAPDVTFAGLNVTIDAATADFQLDQVDSVNAPSINAIFPQDPVNNDRQDTPIARVDNAVITPPVQAAFVLAANDPFVLDVVEGVVQEINNISNFNPKSQNVGFSAADNSVFDLQHAILAGADPTDFLAATAAGSELEDQPLIQLLAENGNACVP